jgi:hypothetical protein
MLACEPSLVQFIMMAGVYRRPVAQQYAFVGTGLLMMMTATLLVRLQTLDIKILGVILLSSGILVSALARPTPKTDNPFGLFRDRDRKGWKRSWPTGLASFVLLAGAFYLLHLDAIAGHNNVACVLFFAFSAICWMSYIIYLGTLLAR